MKRLICCLIALTMVICLMLPTSVAYADETINVILVDDNNETEYEISVSAEDYDEDTFDFLASYFEVDSNEINIYFYSFDMNKTVGDLLDSNDGKCYVIIDSVWGVGDSQDPSWLGDYDSTDEYFIYDEFDLASFKRACYLDGKNFDGKTINLMNDLDLTEHYWLIDATDCLEESCFSGVFNGNDHSISGLRLNPIGHFYNGGSGLFPFIRNAVIKNLKLESIVENGNAENIGLLVGLAADSAIYNCSSSGSVDCRPVSKNASSAAVGGLIGRADHCAIINCSSSADISLKALSDGEYTDHPNYASVGGLIGTLNCEAEESYCLLNSFATGDVYAEKYDCNDCNSTDFAIGGLVGRSSDDIYNCYSIGEVNHIDYTYVGSVVGKLDTEKLDDNGNYVGDFMVGKLYYLGDKAFGNIDLANEGLFAEKITSPGELLDKLNGELDNVNAIINEHRDILQDTSWADLVEQCGAESFAAKEWAIADENNGYPVFYVEIANNIPTDNGPLVDKGEGATNRTSPSKTNTKAPKQNTSTKSPSTGENTMVLALTVASLGALGVVLKANKKQK